VCTLVLYICPQISMCPCNLEICAISGSGNCMPISRLHSISAQSHNFCWESSLLFEFPSCINVMSVPKELLQVCCHRQLWAYTQAPPCQLRETPFPSVGTERPQTSGVPPFKASPSRRALNCLALVSSDALILLICYIREPHLRDLKVGCTISVRLAHSFWILRMRRVICTNS